MNQNPLEAVAGFIPVTGFISLVFAIIFLWWVIYTLVLIYHWYKYARQSALFAPLLITHVILSGAIVLFMTALPS